MKHEPEIDHVPVHIALPASQKALAEGTVPMNCSKG